MKVYMDNAATTQLDKRVFFAMKPFLFKKYGNASSLHAFGLEARRAIENSRESVAKIINAEKDEIYFTSGGTESDNIALRGIAYANESKGNHIITSAIEHHAILHTCQALEKEGFGVTYLPVTKDGFVRLEDLKNAITEKTILVTIMHANNEIGTIQPIEEIGKLCREKKIYFHTDAVQSVGKLKIDVKKMNLDSLSASAHKFYGPKGIGFLYVRKGVNIKPIMFGGGHEKGLRSGTENVPGIVGLSKALELSSKEMKKESARNKKMRDKLIKGVLKISHSWVNGSKTNRLNGNANFGFDFIEGEALIMKLDMKGVAASTGSACSTQSLSPSHVLMGLGLSHVKCHGSLRLTLGRFNSEKEVDYVLNVLPKIVQELRDMSPLREDMDLSAYEKEFKKHGHEH
ncbi:MAG: cysteine desulfurase NifS [Candidatus Diapherotrites archaeon]